MIDSLEFTLERLNLIAYNHVKDPLGLLQIPAPFGFIHAFQFLSNLTEKKIYE